MSQKLITKHQWLLHSLYGQKYWDTPYFRREKGLPNCGNKYANIIHVLKNCISTSVRVLKCMKWLYVCVQVTGVWWWVFGSRSAFKVTPEVFSCLSADQTSPLAFSHYIILYICMLQTKSWDYQISRESNPQSWCCLICSVVECPVKTTLPKVFKQSVFT